MKETAKCHSLNVSHWESSLFRGMCICKAIITELNATFENLASSVTDSGVAIGACKANFFGALQLSSLSVHS